MNYEVKTISNKEFTMHYLQFGHGRTPLVILPGLSVQSVLTAAPAIEKQYRSFTKAFTVYLFDRRADLPPVYSVYDMANDTAKAMVEIGLSSVCLFGASQGGMMAMTIAAIHPELVGRLALGSTACHMKGSRSRVIGDWISLARKGDAEKLYLAFSKKLYPPQVVEKSASLLKQMAKTVTQEELERFIRLAEGIRGLDITDLLGDIKCPVLALGDADDAVLGAVAVPEIEAQMAHNPAFESYLYRGYGHAVYDMAPDFGERLLRFFTKA